MITANPKCELRLGSRVISFPRRPLLMGILNINDDSFSGDGRVDVDWALERARELVRQGADIIDVGAESARTNREAISEDAEIARLSPFLERFDSVMADVEPVSAAQLFPPALSVNTWRPRVASASLEIRCDLLNDMGGLPTPENAESCARHGVTLLIMHTTAPPKVAQDHVRYRDVVRDVETFFQAKIQDALTAGLNHTQLVLDPGLDFAKPPEDSIKLVGSARRLADLGCALLLPVSRKSFIGATLNLSDPRDRDAGTVATVVAGALRGAAILRVHQVDAMRLTLDTLDRILAE